MTDEARSDAKKEQIKLRATFLNNIGVGIMLIGVFTPVTRVILEFPTTDLDVPLMIAWMTICFATGLCLHLLGAGLLKGLDG